MEALVQEENTVYMMVGTFAPKTRQVMKVGGVSGVNISIMCNEIVTNKHDRCFLLHICHQDDFEIFEIYTNITLWLCSKYEYTFLWLFKI